MTTIVCINTFHKGSNYYNITIGKKYTYDESVNPNHPMNWVELGYWIKDDNNRDRKVPKECFVTLEEYREMQLNKIL